MKSNFLLPALAVVFAAFALSGCSNGQPRFKGVEAYKNTTEPNDYDKLPPMDPYSYGGTAYASGGLAPAASYGTGANDPFDGDPAHYVAMADRDGPDVPPVDWGDGHPLDTSGYIVVEPPKPIVETPEK